MFFCFETYNIHGTIANLPTNLQYLIKINHSWIGKFIPYIYTWIGLGKRSLEDRPSSPQPLIFRYCRAECGTYSFTEFHQLQHGAFRGEKLFRLRMPPRGSIVRGEIKGPYIDKPREFFPPVKPTLPETNSEFFNP